MYLYLQLYLSPAIYCKLAFCQHFYKDPAVDAPVIELAEPVSANPSSGRDGKTLFHELEVKFILSLL